jgi:hypothetical protein
MPDKRRTTTQMLTTEERAFLRSDARTASPSGVDGATAETLGHNVARIPVAAPTPQGGRSSVLSKGDTQRSMPSRPCSPLPTQSVTLRLREAVARKLRSASIERSLDYRVPHTQQAIADVALTAWLERNGYLIEE